MGGESSSVGGPAAADIDRGLVSAVASGSAEALAQLYDRHAPTVYGLARRILGRLEDAEEVVQDVFSQVWRTARDYRAERASVAGWMVMLTRARAIDRLRATRARPDLSPRASAPAAIGAASQAPSPEQSALEGDRARRIRDALDTLPVPQRDAILLAYYEGLSQSEIAARTGTPLGTVKTRIRSAMDALRERLR